MTLYLTDKTKVDEIKKARQAGMLAVKLYPAGATTNSRAGVNDIKQLYTVFEALCEYDMPLQVHGEVVDPEVDIFDRESRFIEQHLLPIHKTFPELKIVFEHITTTDAADFVQDAGPQIAATLTPQHMMLNRNDLLAGGIRPHNYCLPVLKRRSHQQRLRQVVTSGSSKFFLGSDSAPHNLSAKQSACGCAGCYTAPAALELYTQVFEELDALDKLESFASNNGADFYGLERNKHTITLVRQNWTVPDSIRLSSEQTIIPFHAGQTLNWQIQ